MNDDDNNTLGTWYTPGDNPTQEPDLYVKMKRVCNRCNAPRPASVTLCRKCGCPEFRVKEGSK